MVVGGFVASRLGVFGDWFSAAGTAAHEASHAAVADVLTGRVLSITVFRDGGGVAITEASDSWWRTFAVSAAGYTGAMACALALTTAVLFGRASRTIALAAGGLCLLALALWTPFRPSVRGIEAGDQHLTWYLLAGAAAVLAGSTWLPETARRVALAVFAAGLVSDAFRAGRDLVVAEGGGRQVQTDADGLHAAVPLLSAGAWSWAMRMFLFVVAGVWLWWAGRRWFAGAERRAPAGPKG